MTRKSIIALAMVFTGSVFAALPATRVSLLHEAIQRLC